MAHPYHHALSSVRKWGGRPEDYMALHSWFDESKAHLADFRHRALRHHSEGIFLAERIFGETIQITGGRRVPVASSASSTSVRTSAASRPRLTGCERSRRSRG